MTVHRNRRGRALAALGDLILSAAALGGAACIVLVLLALTAGMTLVMFKTGSMSPTIPAGSLALVREVPASELRLGDIATVDREGGLPVTHRITSITAASAEGARTVTMRGDANEADDPMPYTITTARVVLASAPGLAPLVVWFSQPLALGSISVAAAVLVGWVFWPQKPPARRRAEPSAVPSARTHIVIPALAAISMLALPAPPAQAAPPASTPMAPPGWTDQEVASTQLTAGLLPPEITACSARTVLLAGPELKVSWRYPSAIAPSPMPESTFFFSTSGLLDLSALLPGSSSTVGPTGGVYTTTFSSSLLGGLLGGTAYAGVSTSQGGWQSPPASITATAPALVGPGSCLITPPITP